MQYQENMTHSLEKKPSVKTNSEMTHTEISKQGLLAAIVTMLKEGKYT